MGFLKLLCFTWVVIALPVHAAPLVVTFTSDSVAGSGSLAGTGPNASGYLIFDSDAGNATGGSPGNGFYVFGGAPYEFSIQLDGFGTFSGSQSLVQITDDGPQGDTVQIVGQDGQYQAGIAWFGPTSTFTGLDIPSISILNGMNPNLNILNTATAQFDGFATLSSISIAPVPIPATVWLLGSALGYLGWTRRKA